MRNGIILLNYHFTFTVIKEETRKCVDVTYYDESRPESTIYSVVHEDMQLDVLPYKAAFNAHNAISELPEDIFDELYDAKLLKSLEDWLQTNYSQTAFMEVVNNAEENN